jgi:hypothetical protein
MTLSMHQASAPVFIQGLTGLVTVLDKAAAHVEARKLDPAALLQARLYPDMFPFARQVQITTDFAKGAVARLAGVEPPPYEDVETSFAELKARVEATIAYLRSFEPARIDGSEDRDITLVRRGETSVVKGRPYLLQQAMPNFYFHLTTAYAILRHNGVELGKRDFLGTV